ncbi:DinB family protein [Sphaerisporangium sp. TRM90804]|uniref:DinB family protein n=1 Tax=Sphaerisporangium sp. TRM90804 TaxID=3031113 RepID=UPI00244BC3FA|nr:DinB family protein [Sphaerisporangium sp. TRM90804]MDH2427528.1 DinB family protein [Sphaerisporangium sp. TRM90804]
MPVIVPPVADEREGLLGYLAQHRYVLRTAAHGLTDEQARATPTASALSVGGLIKHCASVERTWMNTIRRGPRPSPDAYQKGFVMGPGETLDGVLAEHESAARETDEVVRGIADLGQAVPAPRGVPWCPPDVEAWSVRWVLLHLITETARHAGHADIVRESIDGATAYPLMAAAEGWPATSWIQPWRPGEAAE